MTSQRCLDDFFHRELVCCFKSLIRLTLTTWSKLCIISPLFGESIGHQWILATHIQWRGKYAHAMPRHIVYQHDIPWKVSTLASSHDIHGWLIKTQYDICGWLTIIPSLLGHVLRAGAYHTTLPIIHDVYINILFATTIWSYRKISNIL